jgi:hypothetical protein
VAAGVGDDKDAVVAGREARRVGKVKVQFLAEPAAFFKYSDGRGISAARVLAAA